MLFVIKICLAWITLVGNVQSDQSLSFSVPINRSILSSSSFWHDTIPTSLFHQTLRFKLYLNELQGLLFYGIDNFYQTLWLEFDSTNFIINYYNFQTENIEQTKLDIKKLCLQHQSLDNILDLALSLRIYKMVITCNRNEVSAYYQPYTQFKNNDTFNKFIAEMTSPIPDFQNNTSENQTYVWIGNTPSSNMNSYRNNRLESRTKNLLGCVVSFSSGDNEINITSAGTRVGNLIEPSCRPMCSTNPCYEGSRCIELWRERFKCQCGYSKYIGRFCNETYGIRFDGNLSVNISMEEKLQTFRFVFKQIYFQDDFQSFKLLSIQFIFNQNLYIYIDNRRFLQIKFTSEKLQTIDLFFSSQIEYHINYILTVDVDINEMIFKLVNKNYGTVEQKSIPQGLPNLVTLKLSVGDSHADFMKWMNRFSGCISNLILTTSKKTFIWNTIPGFDKLPKCAKKGTRGSSERNKNRSKNALGYKRGLTTRTPSTNQASAAPIVIGVIVVLVMVVIAIVFMYKYRDRIFRNRQETTANKKLRKIKRNQLISEEEPPICHIPFKPAYIAANISHSPEQGKSQLSIQRANTPPLVMEEDETC